MRRLSLLVIVVTAASQPAFAGDSTWLVCRGAAAHGANETTPILVSALEHRGASGDTRDLAITLVHGDHVGRGAIKNVVTDKASPLTVRAIDGKHAITFTGTATLASDLHALVLDGSLDPAFGVTAKAARVPATAKLTCEEL